MQASTINQFFQFLSFALAHPSDFVGAMATAGVALIAFLRALIVLFQLIPGNQPEALLQALADRFQSYVDFIEKHSRKSGAAATKGADAEHVGA